MNRMARLAAAAVLLAGIGAGVGRPQGGGPGGEGYGFQTPLNTQPTLPIPTGRSGDAGFYWSGGSEHPIRFSESRTGIPDDNLPLPPRMHSLIDLLYGAAHVYGGPQTWTDLVPWPPRCGLDFSSADIACGSIPCASEITFEPRRERASPGVRLDVVESVDPVRTGAETVYIVRVTNTGAAVETNLVLVCELPAGMMCAGVTGPTDYLERVGVDFNRPGPDKNTSTVTFEPVRELGLGAEVVYRMRATAGRHTGTVTFKAILTSDRITTPVTKEESTVVTER